MSKRLVDINKDLDKTKVFSLEEAVSILKGFQPTKFDQTVDIVVKTGLDPKHADQLLRGNISLPHGTGKTLRVAVFARDDAAEEAKKAGADIVGVEDLAEKIQKGDMDFDRCIATPDMMATVGKLGRILGPKGLMPNPNLGTVTKEVGKAVERIKKGEVVYRVDKFGLVHAGVAKLGFSEKQIIENIQAIFEEIIKKKPSGVKGNYIKKVSISSTMSPGLEVDITTLRA